MTDPSTEEIIDLIAQRGRVGRQQLFEAQIPDKIAKLCAALRGAEAPLVRQVLCNLMASLGEAEALPCLLTALDDVAEQVVTAAEDAIGNCSAGKEIQEPLRGELGRRLLEFLADSNPAATTRTGAIYALGLMGYKEALPNLLSALESPIPLVRRSAAEAVSHIGDSTAIAPLQSRYARETDEQVKRYIRISLKSLTA
jgi:hypothetical protein